MIEWQPHPIFVVTAIDKFQWVVKVRESYVKEPKVTVLLDEKNVRLSAYYGTVKNRLIGYVFEAKYRKQLKRPKWKNYNQSLFLSYSLPQEDDRKLSVLYQDENLKVLSFGVKPILKDYFLALRITNSKGNEHGENSGT